MSYPIWKGTNYLRNTKALLHLRRHSVPISTLKPCNKLLY